MPAKQTTSPWVWAFLFLVLASFTAFIIFLDQKVVNSSSGRAPTPASSAERNKPTIDFYKVLPNRELEITVSDDEQEAIENPSINKKIESKLILQVGSFKDSEKADSLKARLAFMGLQARVESAQVNDNTWHRVKVGPFQSQTRLSQAKNLLIENNIKYTQRTLAN